MIQSGHEERTRLVIIGNGMAGVSVVEEILKMNGRDPSKGKGVHIMVFGEEPHVNYNRILLSDVLSGKKSMESIILNPRSWYEKEKIDLRLGIRITGIDSTNKKVIDSAGGETPYDCLVIAVGGVPFIPPIRGVGKKGVLVFRNMEDTINILDQAKSGKKAVVIGGGLLGLEAARGLVNHGVYVTVVHLMDRLMEQQLDGVGSSLLKRDIERMGISVKLNCTAQEIVGEDRVEGLRLAKGETLDADMVLICTGIKPNMELARKVGIQTNQGILVDDQMRTSAPEIFSVGDAIEHRGKTYGLVAPLREQARVVADQIVGMQKEIYQGTVSATTLKVADVKLTSAGNFLGGSGFEELVYVDTHRGIYKKLVFRGEQLVGMILLGENQDGPRLFNLIQSGENISHRKNQLLGSSLTSIQADAPPGLQMADDALVCNCNSVSKGMIMTSIREKGLRTRDEVATCTSAGTGCGSCSQLVDDLIQSFYQSTEKPSVLPVKKSPSATPVSLKSMDLEKIKQSGLEVDWEKIREKGASSLEPEDFYRLKTYGVCSQKHPGYFMVRIRIPGGQVSHEQLDVLADLSERHGRGWAHLTIRQDLELHWVRLEEVPDIFQKLEEIGLSTRSACGHTMRNVMACPHSDISEGGLLDIQPLARAISDYFLKRSELINPSMPNRMNIYFAACGECAPHAQINEIGFVAVRNPHPEKGGPDVGFECWVGGSLGSHPILGFKLKEFISPEEVLPVCQAVFYIHTRYGSRKKARSRLKFLIEEWGIDKFSDAFEKAFLERKNLPENKDFYPLMFSTKKKKEGFLSSLRLGMWRGLNLLPLNNETLGEGCVPQRQKGYTRVSVQVPLGEIQPKQLRTLGRISSRFGNGEIYFTKDQDVELHWIPKRRILSLSRSLETVGLYLKGKKTPLKLQACPGTEFCVLAVTNAQGAGKEIMKSFSERDTRKSEVLKGLSIHISGCPNSCAKHQVADIGFAGTMVTVGEERRFSYLLFLGGRMEDEIRLGEVVRKGITEEMIVPTVDSLIDLFLEGHKEGETFYDFVTRLGLKELGRLLELRLNPFLPKKPARISLVPQMMEVEA